MARLYRGNLHEVPEEVLDRLCRDLPDDFHIAVGVSVEGHDVDLWVLRPLGDSKGVDVVIEVKELKRPIESGSENGPWLLSDGRELNCNSSTNPHHQAVTAANGVADWLWKNQHCVWSLSEHLPRDHKVFGVWPSVLLASPTGTGHKLPMSPSTGFGSWYFGDSAVDDLIANLLGWRPRLGRPLSRETIDNILDRIGVQEWEHSIAA